MHDLQSIPPSFSFRFPTSSFLPSLRVVAVRCASIADGLLARNQVELYNTHQWTTLRELTGQVVELHILGLTSPIRSIRVHSIDDARLSMVQSLFVSHSPQYVCMNISASTVSATWNNLREVLEPLSLSCTHLTLNLDFESEDSEHSFDARFLRQFSPHFFFFFSFNVYVQLQVPELARDWCWVLNALHVE